MRPALCEDALRLGRILAGLMPDEPEVHGLVALMEIQASRSTARVGADGAPILLLDQNRALWDQVLIRRGLAALDRRRAMRTAARSLIFCRPRLPRAMHGRGRPKTRTGLASPTSTLSSPRCLLLRSSSSIAPSRCRWRSAHRLDSIWWIRSSASLRSSNYHLLPSVRGDLLVKLGRVQEALPEFERAASLTRNARERELLLERARACETAAPRVRVVMHWVRLKSAHTGAEMSIHSRRKFRLLVSLAIVAGTTSRSPRSGNRIPGRTCRGPPDGKVDMNAPARRTADGKTGSLRLLDAGRGRQTSAQPRRGSEARRGTAAAVGGRALQGTDREQRQGPSWRALLALRHPGEEQHPGRSQGRADARRHDLSARVADDLPADLHRWPAAAEGRPTHLDGVLHRSLGRRYLHRRNDRTERQDVARHERAPGTEALRVIERFTRPNIGRITFTSRSTIRWPTRNRGTCSWRGGSCPIRI